MYDKILKQDVIDFKRGSDNIYDLQYRYSRITKIIRNRTKEKIDILNMLLENHQICNEDYTEMMEMERIL